MLTTTDLLRLYRETRDERVLSVYLPRVAPDPAQRAGRRTQLDAALSRIRRSLAGSSPAEQDAYAAAVDALLGSIPSVSSAGTPVVAFVTPRGVLHMGNGSAPVGTLACWNNGIVAGPYLRSLKQQRPVLVLTIDSRRASVFRYELNTATLLETFEAVVGEDHTAHMGDAPRLHMHQGVRGTTGRDEAERREQAAFERMVHDLAPRLQFHGRDYVWLVVGGAASAVAAVTRMLPANVSARTRIVTSLTASSGATEVARITADAASELTALRDSGWVALLSESERTASGRVAVKAALEERSVHLLLLSATWLDREPEAVEPLVRGAFDSGADIEVVTNQGAEILDQMHEGAAAVLRYSLPQVQAPPEITLTNAR